MENNPTTPNVYILCFIWVQFSFCALQNDKWYDRIYCFIHYFYWEGGYLEYGPIFTIMFFTICVGRGGPKGNSAKFTKSSVFLQASLSHYLLIGKLKVY